MLSQVNNYIINTRIRSFNLQKDNKQRVITETTNS